VSLVARLREPAGVAHPVAVVRRLGWGVGDQAVSSLSNFGMGIIVARTLGAAGFGAFTLAYVTYSVVLNLSRGLSSDPLLVRYSAAEPSAWRRGTAAATGTALTVGTLAGVVCLGVGLALPHSDLRGGFVALGVGLPGLMLQDSWRFTFFAIPQGSRAFTNDLVWTVLLLAAMVALLRTGNLHVWTAVLAFGGTAWLAAAFGYLQTRVLPRPGRVRSWLVEQRSLATRYAVENVSVSLAFQIRAFALGAAASLVAVGEVRAAELLMGPFVVVLMGISIVAVPESSFVLRRSPQSLPGFSLRLGVGLGVLATLWGVVVYVLLPHGLGTALLGSIWEEARALLPPVVIAVALNCLSTAAMGGVRAMGAARRSLAAQLVASALYVVGGVGGAVRGGAIGTCWGVAVGAAIAAAVWRYQLRRTVRDFVRAGGPHPAVVPWVPAPTTD
jgi:O-antigen/teichoic acid export membrane protein